MKTFITIAALLVATPTLANECLYSQMVTAYTWAALDDAETNGLDSTVVHWLEDDLAVARELEAISCGYAR